MSKPTEVYRSIPKLAVLVSTICLSPFYFGYTIQYLGTFEFKTIAEIFNINIEINLAQGLLNGIVPIGAAIQALISFLMLKYFSRRWLISYFRKSLLVVNAIALIFGGLLFVRTQFTLFIARFMQGLCVGFYSTLAPLIIK